MFTSIIAGVTTWFKSPINTLVASVVGGLFGILLGVLTLTYVEKISAEHKVTNLTTKIESVERDLASAKATIVVKDNAIAALEQIKKDEAAVAAIEESVKKEVYDAPASEDAPIAPVLGRALDGVGRMLSHGK